MLGLNSGQGPSKAEKPPKFPAYLSEKIDARHDTCYSPRELLRQRSLSSGKPPDGISGAARGGCVGPQRHIAGEAAAYEARSLVIHGRVIHPLTGISEQALAAHAEYAVRIRDFSAAPTHANGVELQMAHADLMRVLEASGFPAPASHYDEVRQILAVATAH